jgi:hypothetical protein
VFWRRPSRGGGRQPLDQKLVDPQGRMDREPFAFRRVTPHILEANINA